MAEPRVRCTRLNLSTTGRYNELETPEMAKIEGSDQLQTHEERHKRDISDQEQSRNENKTDKDSDIHNSGSRSVSRGRRRARVWIEEPDEDVEAGARGRMEEGLANEVERSPSVTFEDLRSTGPQPRNVYFCQKSEGRGWYFESLGEKSRS